MEKGELLSVVLLSYYSKDKLAKAYNKVSETLNKNNINFELIIVDDGSKDNSFEIAKELEEKHNNIFAYQLSKNYTSHYSIFAGLSVCKGDCAVVIPDDEQQPYEIIVKMVGLWKKGQQIILPYRNSRDDQYFSKMFSTFYYRLMNKFSIVEFPVGGIDTFFIDREIIDILNSKIKPINTSSITEILRLGFDPHYLPFERERGTNAKSRWTFKKKLKLASDTFFSSSKFPIKLIVTSGFIIAFAAVILAIFYLYIKLFGNPDFWGSFPDGWISLVLLISFFGGAILFSIGVIAEYIWRIYEEVKNRPGYIIKKK